MSVRLFNAAEVNYFLTNSLSLAFVGPPKNGDPEPILKSAFAVVFAVGILLERYLDVKKRGR